MNELTNLVLQSPHMSRLVRGEVVEVLAPGTSHQVQTPAATASAIGTEFEGQWANGNGHYIVVEGAVLIKNKQGSVLVKAGFETTVKKGQAPSPPQPVDAQAAVAWTKSLPAATVGQNVALDANGGSVAAVSSEDPAHPSGNAIDGRLDTSWQTAPGKVAGQSITIAFPGTKIYEVSEVLLDPAGTPASTDLKDFDLRISTNSTDSSDFLTVFSGTAKQAKKLQRFTFAGPRRARYLQLVPKTNYGSTAAISVAEIEVVGVPDTQPHFNQPTGVTVDPQGNVDVAELAFGLIQRLTPDGQLLASIGASGHNHGQLSIPVGLGTDPSGNIYVVSAHDARIVKFDPTGKFLLDWGSAGSGPGQFANPIGLAVDSQGNVYVADPNNSRIEKFSSSGQYSASFGSRYNPWYYGPTAIAVDAQGNMYITADGDHIDKLSPTGQPLARYGSSGKGPGQFVSAEGIALDTAGNIYVADGNNRIEKFSPAGQFLLQWTTTAGQDNAPQPPHYLAVDRQGNVYVTFGTQGRGVNKYSSSGQLLANWQ
jgi:sugar lactone lactonase YvrE